MRNIIVLFAVVISSLSSCNNTPILKGELSNKEVDKIYLSQIVREHYSRYRVVDSAIVTDGKFEFNLENRSSQLYFIGNKEFGGKVFVEPTSMQIDGTVTATKVIKWNVSGSSLHKLYENFIQQKHIIEFKKQRDSSNLLFRAARSKGDREEMARIKKESGVFYSSKIYKRVDSLVNYKIKVNMDNAFGIYLYKSRVFSRLQLKTVEDVNKCREYISGFSGAAISTSYIEHINEKLNLFDKCAIGAIAPEITGKDTLGKVTKLSDYKGKYVIVDFWSSGCKFCRLESPNLQKAIDKYGDKNFTILGVSSDFKKDRWMKAIHEDESYWDQIKMEREDMSAINKSYCINGIPHIILVDPQGKIIAKDLRGKDIYEIPGKFLD